MDPTAVLSKLSSSDDLVAGAKLQRRVIDLAEARDADALELFVRSIGADGQRAVMDWNPEQPREPSGSPEGGQWAGGGSVPHWSEEPDWPTGAATTSAPLPPPGPLKFAKLTKVGEQMGSNKGGVYADAQGKKFYVKQGKSADHVRNEMLAAKLYRIAGTPTLRYRVVEGGKHIATEIEKLDKNNASALSPEERTEAAKDFAVHAWLANWDVVGLGGDNIGTVGGQPIPLDLGGALAYRAQGAPKGKAFGDTAGEIDTLRDPRVNPDSAHMFGGMTPAQLRESASFVTGISDSAIREAVKDSGSSDALADRLIKRRDDIAQRAKTFGTEGDPTKPSSTVVFAAGDPLPVKGLNGIKFEPWSLPEGTSWNDVDGQADLGEAELSEHQLNHKQLASGLVMREPDGRIWLVRPKNAYGGYQTTFPKGRVEADLSLQANAIKEAFEETGLKARITGLIGDREGDLTITRYYLAEREAGEPRPDGKESDGVVLVPPIRLGAFLNRKRDKELAATIAGGMAHDAWDPDEPRDEHGEWTGGSATSTPAFKAWFKNSKVVNEGGSPKVMYHATDKSLTEFRPFTHFGTANAANDRWNNLTTFYNETINNPGRSEGFNIQPVYLKIENPLRMPDLASVDEYGDPVTDDDGNEIIGKDGEPKYPVGWEGEEAVATWLLNNSIIDIDEFEEHRSNDKALSLLGEKGYDGIVYENAIEAPGSESWIAFDPSQVKSATANKGAFDPRKPSIVDTLTTMFDRPMSKGPGSRVSREETPSPSTIYRIEKAQEALEEEVGEEVGILTAGDELVCETCQDIADGGPYTLDEAEGLIPAHVNCLPGDSLVSPAGRITGAYERFYDGDLVVVRTTSDRELACTPNHPVLTDKGWVAARSIKVGGYVVSRRIVERSDLVEADDEKVPARIEDVARAFLESGQTLLFKVPLARPDFHGDGTEGEIAVVGTNRLLSRDGDAALLEHPGEFALDGRIVDGEQLACSGALDLHVEGVALAAPGNVGRPNLRGPGGGVHTSPFDTLLFGRRAEFDAILCEQQSNRAALNIIRGCKPDDGVAITISGDNIPHVVGAYLGEGLIPEPSVTDLLCASGALCHSVVSDLHAIGHRPQSDTALEEDRSDSVWTRAKLVGERFEADAGDVVIDEPVSIDRLHVAFRQPTNCNTVLKQNLFSEPMTDVVFNGDVDQRFPVDDIITDELVDVEYRSFSGHVYDLQTTKVSIIAGHSWLAPG